MSTTRRMQDVEGKRHSKRDDTLLKACPYPLSAAYPDIEIHGCVEILLEDLATYEARETARDAPARSSL